MRTPLGRHAHRIVFLAALLGFGPFLPGAPSASTGWIPPRPVTVLLPGATFAAGSTHTIEMTIRANGAAAFLNWTASGAGMFPIPVTPSSGSLTVPADSVRRVTLSVFLPDTAVGSSTLKVNLTDQNSAAFVAKVSSSMFAATGSRHEVWPLAGAWDAPAGTPGFVRFQIHSRTVAGEHVFLSVGRSNTDANNFGALFPGSTPPESVSLPGGATITVSVPTTIPWNAYGGSANAVQFLVSAASTISTAAGHAMVSSAFPDSLPTALYPTGLVPTPDGVAGRDGPTELPGRGFWLLPSGLGGVRVMESLPLAHIGPVDANGNGTDDRIVGQVRIPSYAASIAVVPRFVGPLGDTLDLGLLAAGRAGLMLLDLRTVVDPTFGTWEDVFDQDLNGIDDRILRTIPIAGFATDVEWFRAPTGRIVALVAAADTGSVPVAVTYNPASVVAGTGAGVVAIDVTAAFDSLGAVPYAAGELATPGSALDLELKRAGAGEPDLAVADGDAGVSMYHLSTASGAPATVTFTPLGSATLSSAWGTPYARDLAWISNTRDSVYLAVAASAGGLQIVRAPLGGAPSLVLSQEARASAIGLAGTWTGNLGVALGAGGVAVMRAPGGAELDQIDPAAPPPYTGPVTLARGQTWSEGFALEAAWQWAPSSSATSMRFQGTTGPMPDLLVSDGSRLLLLRPGQATIVGVREEPSPPRAMPLAISVTPNPIETSATIRVFDASARLNAAAAEVAVFDVQGRLVRRIRGAASAKAGAASLVRFTWDGRDDRGRRLGSGRYWLRVREGSRTATRPILILR